MVDRFLDQGQVIEEARTKEGEGKGGIEVENMFTAKQLEEPKTATK